MRFKSYKATVGACALGYMSSAIANNLAPIFFIIFQSRFFIDDEKLSILILINFVVQFIVDFLGAKFIDNIGYRASFVVASGSVSLGLCFMGLLPNLMDDKFIALLISVITYAIGAGILEVLVSPIVEYSCEGKNSAVMSFVHSFYCWGQMLAVLGSTLLLFLFGEDFWSVIPFIWAVLPFINIFLFLAVPLKKPIAKEEKKSFRSMFTSLTFIMILLMMTCAGASEIAMSQWSSLFAEKALGVEKVIGDILGPCLFALMMGVGRILYTIFGEKFKLERLLIASSLGCILCYLVVSLSPLPYLSLCACAMTGFFVSIMWPGMLSISAKKYPNGGTAMFGVAALFGDIGCAMGPFLAGMVSDYSEGAGIMPIGDGLKLGLGSTILFPILLFVCLLVFLKRTVRVNSK